MPLYQNHPSYHVYYLYLLLIIIFIYFQKGNKISKNSLIIAVTGTPAAGKSSFAKELSKNIKGSEIIEINDVVDEYKLFSRVDEMGSKVVKLKELDKKMQEIIKEKKNPNLIIVGHLVPEIKLKQDVTVVLRLNLNELIKRLEARDYQKEKVRENIISESIDYCGLKARETCKETYEIETEKEKREMIDYLISKTSGKSHKAPEIKEISRFEELLELVTSSNKYNL